MTKLEKIEKAVEALTPGEVAKLRAWIEEYQERLFDEAIERDAKAGKLDKILAEVRANHKAGRGEEFHG